MTTDDGAESGVEIEGFKRGAADSAIENWRRKHCSFDPSSLQSTLYKSLQRTISLL